MFRLVGAVVGIIVVVDLLVGLVLAGININKVADTFLDLGALSTGTAIALWFVVLAPLRRDASRERAVTRRRERLLQDDADRQEFDARVHRAMEMAGTEAVAHRAVARALERGTGRLSAELLLADSSEASLKHAAHAAPDGSAPGARSPLRGSARRSAAARPWCFPPARRSTPAHTWRIDRKVIGPRPACPSAWPVAASAYCMPPRHPYRSPPRWRCLAWKRWPRRQAPASGCCG